MTWSKRASRVSGTSCSSTLWIGLDRNGIVETRQAIVPVGWMPPGGRARPPSRHYPAHSVSQSPILWQSVIGVYNLCGRGRTSGRSPQTITTESSQWPVPGFHLWVPEHWDQCRCYRVDLWGSFCVVNWLRTTAKWARLPPKHSASLSGMDHEFTTTESPIIESPTECVARNDGTGRCTRGLLTRWLPRFYPFLQTTFTLKVHRKFPHP